MQYKKGVISIYLSLTMVIILALIASLIEGVRVNLAKIQIERAVMSAMQSTLADYDLNMLDKYGLIMLDGSYGEATINKEKIETLMRGYLEKSLNPEKNQPTPSIINQLIQEMDGKSMDLYQIAIDKVDLSTSVSMTDQKGELFKYEILAYMKYKGPTTLATGFLEKIKDFTQIGKSTEALEKKIDIDDKSAELGEELQDLMGLIDGVLIKKGRVSGQGNYLKQFMMKNVNYENAQINNISVFEAMYPYYYNPSNDIDYVISNLEEGIPIAADYWAYVDEEASLRLTYNEVVRAEGEAREELGKDFRLISQDDEEGQAEYATRLETLNRYYGELKSEIQGNLNSIRQQQKDAKNQITSSVKEQKKILKKIETLADAMLSNGEKSQEIIKGMGQKSEALEKEIGEYRKYLEENKNQISKEVLAAIEEDIEILEASYLGTKSNLAYGNLSKMGETIRKNMPYLSNITGLANITNHTERWEQDILEAGKKVYEGYKETKLPAHYRSTIVGTQSSLEQLSHSYLAFDYGRYQVGEAKDKEDPRDSMEDKGKQSLLQTLLGLTDISNYIIEKTGLPSSDYLIEQEDEEQIEFKKSKYLKKVLGQLTNMGSALETMDNLLDKVLINEYILLKFDSYIKDKTDKQEETRNTALEGEDETNSGSAFKYEAEYILIGEGSDKENVEKVLNKILQIRFGINFVHCISDAEKRSQALTLATAIVSFFALAGMIQLVQVLIIAAWSYGEAIMDVRQIAKGEAVPLLKTKDNWQLSFSQLINKDYDSGNQESKEKGLLDLNYTDYLRLFLLLDIQEEIKLYRMMDCIQMNLQKENKQYLFKNNLYEITVSIRAKMPTLFIQLPFVPEHKLKEQGEYEFTIEKSFSY